MRGANNDRRMRVLVQPPGNLGERLMAIDASLRSLGREQLIFVGSDAPALTAALLDGIAAMLQHADVVLAPADDGGVVAMASELLAQALQARCRAAGQGVSMTSGSFDVDDLASLSRVSVRLRDDPRPARRRLVAIAARLTAGNAP
jgi:molybdopterin-guanine dinucleotide biosynthesis protein A